MVFRRGPDEEEKKRIHDEAFSLINNIVNEFEKLGLNHTQQKEFSRILENKNITSKVRAYRKMIGYLNVLDNILKYYRPHLEKRIMDEYYKIVLAMDALELDNNKYL